MKRFTDVLRGIAAASALSAVAIAAVPNDAFAAESLGCPDAIIRFLSEEICTPHGSEGELKTCCYWLAGSFQGCCEFANT
jgi:hypothetical protein